MKKMKMKWFSLFLETKEETTNLIEWKYILGKLLFLLGFDDSKKSFHCINFYSIFLVL